MLRVPCKVCGAEILPATAERNDGLCGRCAKGNRPCIYCGGRVDEPLKDGTYAHLFCAVKSKRGEVSLDWKTADDIDWPMVERKVHEKLATLFAHPPNPCPQCELVLWIDTNGGLNFDVYQVFPDETRVRFGNLVKGWIDDMGPFDEAFDAIVEGLPREEFDTTLELDARLRDIVRTKCQELARKNFGYPANAIVTWRIAGDA